MARPDEREKLRILVADSDPERASRISEKIEEQLGAEVSNAADSTTAADLLYCGRFDAVVVSPLVGDISGLDFLIEASLVARSTPLIMVGNETLRVTAAEATEAGAAGFVDADVGGLDRVGETIVDAIERVRSAGGLEAGRQLPGRWERIYHSSFEVAPIALLVADADGTVLDANVEAEKFIGGGARSAIGLNLFDLISGWDVESFKRSAGDDLPVEFSAELKKPGGEVASVSVVLNRLEGTSGELMISLIEPRRPASYRRMWEYLMKDAQDMVALLDEEGRILSTSKGMVSFTGIPESEQIGSLITTFEHPANRQRMMDVFETARASGYVTMDNFEYKLWDGQVRYCNGSVYKLMGGDYLIIARDVTQRRKRELDLEFYGGMVAHELRTPLTAINGYVDLMLRRGGLTHEDVDSLEKIRMSAERIDRTAQALLDISRVGRQETPQSTVDVQRVADEVLDSLSSLTAKKSTSIVIPDRLPDIRFIEEDMKLILSNLLSNALKYGGGEEGLPVIVSCKKCPGRYVFSVKDFGPGIPDSIRDKIVAPFFKSGESDGMGLGLALVRRVVESHGGDFWFESWEDEGSTFYWSVVD
jgi:PAS domain S-box-containing protein